MNENCEFVEIELVFKILYFFKIKKWLGKFWCVFILTFNKYILNNLWCWGTLRSHDHLHTVNLQWIIKLYKKLWFLSRFMLKFFKHRCCYYTNNEFVKIEFILKILYFFKIKKWLGNFFYAFILIFNECNKNLWCWGSLSIHDHLLTVTLQLIIKLYKKFRFFTCFMLQYFKHRCSYYTYSITMEFTLNHYI